MKYNEVKNKIMSFLDAELSASIENMYIECLDNNAFIEEVVYYINKFCELSNVSLIEKLFLELLNKEKELFEQFNKTRSLQKKKKLMMKNKAYFSLLEATVENSYLTKSCLNGLKQEFGDSYLSKLSIFDKANLSEDVKKIAKEIKVDHTESFYVNLYLMLKKWQDITHVEYLENENAFTKFTDTIYRENSFNNPFLRTEYIKKQYVNEKIKNKIISLDEVVKFVIFGFGENVKECLGGKTYGLAVLKSLGTDVPQAFIIPSGYNFKNEDLSFLEKNVHYAVRSSANVEDGEKYSFAGMFDSFLNISFEELPKNILKVRKSINNKRVRAYIERFQLPEPEMSVIVQEFTEPDYAGIWIGNAEDNGLLEYTKGNGEKLVSGHVIPQIENWPKQKTENFLSVNDLEIGSYLLSLQQKIYEKYNIIPDFEWCVCGNKLKMLQFRPATKQITPVETCNIAASEDTVVGIACSSGEYEGVAQYIRYPNMLSQLEENNILLSMFTDPQWLSGMQNAKAIVTAMGGFLCHTAIIARELGIPCITGIGIEGLKKIKDKKVHIDCNTGVIKII